MLLYAKQAVVVVVASHLVMINDSSIERISQQHIFKKLKLNPKHILFLIKTPKTLNNWNHILGWLHNYNLILFLNAQR